MTSSGLYRVLLPGLVWLLAAGAPIADAAGRGHRLDMEVCNIFSNCLNLWFIAPTPQQGAKIKQQLEAELRDLSRIVAPETSGGMQRLWSMLPDNSWFSVNPSVFKLLQISQQHYQSSGGYFNPAVAGQWIKLWQLDKNKLQQPDPASIKKILVSSPGMEHVELQGIRIRGHNPDIRIDFGMLLHGHAVDVTYDVLVQKNIKQFSISMGNTARSRFTSEQQAHMKLAPLHQKVGKSVVALENGEAICSLRSDEDSRPLGGLRYATVLNPKTGMPPERSGAVVTVAQNARDASAGCMALFAAGARDWQKTALGMKLTGALFVSRDGKLEMDLTMTQRLNPDGTR